MAEGTHTVDVAGEGEGGEEAEEKGREDAHRERADFKMTAGEVSTDTKNNIGTDYRDPALGQRSDFPHKCAETAWGERFSILALVLQIASRIRKYLR